MSKDLDPGGLLRKQLTLVAHRIRLVGAVDSLLWAMAVVGISLLLLAWMDIIWHLPVGVRQFIIPIALLVGSGFFAVLMHRAWKQAAADRVARRLDLVGGTGGQVLSGWELLPGNRPVENESDSVAPLARGIASVAVDQASQKASKVTSTEAAPWSESRRSGITAAAVALLTMLFALVAPGAFGTSWNRLAEPSVDTPPYSPLVFEVTPGDAQLTYGQPLEVTAEIRGGAIESASLVLGDPDEPSSKRVAMFSRGAGRWQAVVPRVTETIKYCVTAERGRSRIFDLHVLEAPKIEAATYTITAPSYTKLPPRQGRYPQDRIAGLLGTKVELAIDANRPLESGTVTIEPAEGNETSTKRVVSLSVSPSEPQRAVGIVDLQHGGQWSISVTGSNGVASESPIRIEVELLIDQPPIVRIVQPRPKSYATPDTRIPVVAIAEDDYGVSRLRLYRIIDGSRPIPLDIPVETGVKTVQGGSALPLDAFGVEPGDRITLLARVDDTRPSASQGGESPVVEIDIISQRDFNRLIAARQGKQMLENKFRQARRLLEELASEAEKLQEEMKTADKNNAEDQRALQERIDQLRRKMEEAAKQLEKLADQELPLEVDKQWNELLREQAEALRAAAENTQRMKKEGGDQQDQADEMQKAIDKMRQQQQEQIGQPLDALKKIAPLIAAESKFVQLVARQRAVVDALDRYRQDETVADQADRQQIVQLREEEAALRRSLNDLMNDIEMNAKALGDDPDFQELKQSSLEFVAAVRGSEIDPELSEARQSLGKFDGSQGYSHALVALEEMEKFLGQCNSNGQQAGNCLKNKFAPTLPGKSGGQSLQQMLNQMGLNPGSNSGYSTRGNSGQNVGLYGNQPFAEPQGGGRGNDGRMMPARGQSETASGSGDSGSEIVAELPQTARTSSSDVPLRYRKQTEQYLRRLAEQLDP